MKTIKKISAVLSHLSIILSLCFLTFTVLDWYNPKMAFRINPISSKLLVVFCVVAMLSSIGNLLPCEDVHRLGGKAPENRE